MKKFNLGLCSVSFREHSPEEILKAAKKTGISCIEWGSDVHAPCNNPETLKEIALLQNKYGIKCSSYGTYFYLMRDNLDELISYIKAAKILGTNILRLWCGEKGSNKYSSAEKEALFEECRKAAAIAADENVILCMESHPGTFADTAESSVELMEAVNSSCFRMYWQQDIQSSDEVSLDFAKRISPYTVNIHCFYWKNLKPVPLYEGTESWKKFLAEFSGEKNLLLEFMPDGKFETLFPQSEALKLIVANV